MSDWEILSSETLLATGYAAFLVIVAAGFEVLARRTQRGGGDGKANGVANDRVADTWPFGEIARFQRGLSATLLLLAAFFLALGALRHHRYSDLAMLSAGFLPVLLAGRYMIKKFRGR